MPASSHRPSTGWYPDPGGAALERFWDETGWTTYTREPQLAARPAPQPAVLLRSPAPAPAQSRLASSVLDVTGSALVLASIAALVYLAWTFVGTNVVASVEQSRARTHLEVTTPVAAVDVIPAEAPVAPPAGEVAARIVIPSIGVDQVVHAGTDVETLKRGPGIWEAGAFPGAPGNATVSGHRTTYGGPFRHLDQLAVGDRIVIITPGFPDAVFEVRGSTIVEPSRIRVTENTPGVRLTLTTCDPVGSDAERLVVQAELVEGQFVDQALPLEGWTVHE